MAHSFLFSFLVLTSEHSRVRSICVSWKLRLKLVLDWLSLDLHNSILAFSNLMSSPHGLWPATRAGTSTRKDVCKKRSVNVAYVSDMWPRDLSAGPRSRCFSSRDCSVLPLCRWISGLVCNNIQLLPRIPLSSWFLRLKIFILLSSSGLVVSEPAGLGSLRLTGSTARPFWARQESSDREESSSCTTMLGSLRGFGPEREGGQWWELRLRSWAVLLLQSIKGEPGMWLLRLRGRTVRPPLDCDMLVEASLTALHTRSKASIGLDRMVLELVGRWTSMAAVVMIWVPAAEAPPSGKTLCIFLEKVGQNKWSKTKMWLPIIWLTHTWTSH